MGQVIKVFLNPMALIGVVIGCYIMLGNGMDYVQQILHNPEIYLPQILGVLWGICLAYAMLFKQIYHTDNTNINWKKTFASSFEHLIAIVCSTVVVCGLIWAADMDWGSRFDRYARSVKAQDDFSIIEQQAN